jgi:exonuclease SbcC
VAALDAAKSKALAFQKELAAAQEALDLWKRLHELVGTKDGEDFKNFALSLELQCLLEQANHRLARLAPRYRLEQATDKDGNPRLAFAIADAFQADQERPLSTLSGGETFLVSLALALALADYRALRMPMETLLIDEGFGTLDPDTLNVAMGALEALHASGVQVGVISHVEALKERIFARIAVRPDRPGRSRIHTELVGT